MKTINALLLTALCSGASLSAYAAPQGFEWFPRVPGPGDPLYLIAIDPCHSETNYSPVDPEATLVNPGSGLLELRYKSEIFLCNGAPPVMTAYEIPREIDGAEINYITFIHEQTEYVVENGQITGTKAQQTRWSELPPSAVPMPPAIIGTWYSPGHAEQGLLINMTAKRELLVGWTTYGADGRQRWFSGIVPTIWDQGSVTLTLMDTGTGLFASTPPTDKPATVWGELTLEYRGCGKLRANWVPRPETGLAAGSADMQQLTLPHDAACDIAQYAAAIGHILDIQKLDIETPATFE